VASKRRKGPARWLVAGLSGLAAAGFLGAIISRPGIAQQTPDVSTDTMVNVSTAPALTNQPPMNSSIAQSPSPSQTSSQTVVRTPRLRTRGS
jgi:hypothetical protein